MSVSATTFTVNSTGASFSTSTATSYPTDLDRSRQQVKSYLQKCGVCDERAEAESDRIVRQAATGNSSQSATGKNADLTRVSMLLAIEELTRMPVPSQSTREVIPASIDRPMWNASPVRRAAPLRIDWWVGQLLGGNRIAVLKGRRRYAEQQN
ncbi:hypothetical protein [Novipirellula rosea]|uniref:DUF1549 domain-containing protein n=1 Tax=Novipirellula rosea TaxID=1031540 RepID=A0ABP8N5B9_9BACT